MQPFQHHFLQVELLVVNSQIKQLLELVILVENHRFFYLSECIILNFKVIYQNTRKVSLRRMHCSHKLVD